MLRIRGASLAKQNVMATGCCCVPFSLLVHCFDVFLIRFRFKLMAGGCKWILSLREERFVLGGS
jgi:hypothetical protein